MLYTERAEIIMQMLKKQSIVKITELTRRLNVSVDTVRRDLKTMEEAELLICVRGGARLSESSLQFLPFMNREIVNVQEKRQAAKKAVQYIREGDIISMNSGTTNVIVAQEMIHLKNNFTVITNNVAVITVLLMQPTIKVIVPGGFLDSKEKSFYGRTCEQGFEKYNTDICFLSINAVSLEKGYTDFRFHEIDNMRVAAKNAVRTIAVMDCSKLEKVSKQAVFPLESVNILAVDDAMPDEQRQLYTAHGVEII